MDIRVVIGSNNEKNLKQLGKFLTENGMIVIGNTTDGYNLLRKVYTTYPDLVIVDDRMKGMYGHEISENLIAKKICPIIALIRASESSHYIKLNQEALFAGIIKPIDKEILINTIMLMAKTSKSIIAPIKQAENISNKKNNVIIISEAKQILIKKMNLSEEEAHRRIQKQSMDKGLPKIKIAKMIIRMFK